MDVDVADVLARTLSQVLEEAAFLFAEATPAPPPLGGAVLEARLSFMGDHEGELVLAAPPELCATLAANLLGEDEGGAAATGDDEDAVGELLNMVAGAVLVELYGPDARCLLGLPRVARVAAGQHEGELARADVVATLVEEEGRRIDLSAHLAGGAAP
jgi:CheY-specific phosphatase CheX